VKCWVIGVELCVYGLRVGNNLGRSGFGLFWGSLVQGCAKFQKSRNHLKILGAILAT